jgi:L-lactate dehydrogenase complex protein LldG
MPNNTAKQILLDKLKKALSVGEIDMPFPEAANDLADVFLPQNQQELMEVFAAEFIKLGGNFIYCGSKLEAIEKLNGLQAEKKWNTIHCLEPEINNLFENEKYLKNSDDYSDLEIAITSCEYLVARTGSLLLSSSSPSGRALSVYTPIHICVAFTNQLVWNISDANKKMQEKYGVQLPSTFNIATGPSRTADIEKTLVVGVHGPKEVYVLLINN